MVEQTAEDRLSGVLRVRLGSADIEIPALPVRPARQWVVELQAKLATLAASGGPGEDGLLRLVTETTDAAVDLIVKYDRGGVIAGGSEWLSEHATPRQIRAALDTMREEALPFGGEAGLMQLVLMAARSAAQNSTNGHSPTGDSPQQPSSKRSRPRS